MSNAPKATWTGPDADGDSPAAALSTLLRTLGRHRLLFISITLLCVIAAGLWLNRRAPTYTTAARILVAPVPAGDSSFVGLPLIRASELDPQRAPNTAAQLLESPTAVQRAATRLGTTPAQLDAALEISAISESSLVEVLAEAESAERAAEMATTYTEVALAERDRVLTRSVADAIREVEQQIALLESQSEVEASALDTRLAALRSIATRGDPTLSLARPAPSGESQDAPAALVLIAALLSGALLAGLTIVMIELLVRRSFDEEDELVEVYPLPVLARTPPPVQDVDALSTGDVLPGVREGFRALRGQLELLADDDGAEGASVLLVSPEPDPDRSWCTLYLAQAFASVRRSAVAMEFDPGSPQIAAALGIDPAASVAELLRGASVKTVARTLGSGNAGFVAAPVIAERVPQDEVSARAREFVGDARGFADWVIAGTSPLSDSPANTLAILGSIERIVVVVRIGLTHPDALADLKTLFVQAGREPDGYLVIDERLSSR